MPKGRSRGKGTGDSQRPAPPTVSAREEPDAAPLIPMDPELQRDLEKVNPTLAQRVENQIKLVARFSTWHSEWPPPDVYNDYPPEARDVIMSVLKARTEGGIARADRIADRRERRMDRAQWWGGITAIAGIAGSVGVGMYAGPWVAVPLGAIIVLVCVGGPNVARVVADSIYARGREQQPKQASRSRSSSNQE